MEIFVNGQARQMTGELSVAQLLADMGVAQQRLAVEINREIVPRSAYASQQLKNGDYLEMVQAVGGG
jgi:thiamine biosynthesis protein ThiS